MLLMSMESVAKTATVFLWLFSLCLANIETMQTQVAKGKRVKTSYKTLQSYSKIKCAETCFDEKRQNRCSVAGYNKVTRTCFLSNDSQHDLLDANEEFGVILYAEDPTCAVDGPLLTGANPVPDSYFTASSEYSATYAAYKARIGVTTTCWIPTMAEIEAIPPSLYIQVRFHNLSTVVRLATQGENNAWVTLYRLATSVDCVNFSNLLDGAANNLTFPANTDVIAIVENQLPTPVTALCLRLYPLTWGNGWPDLKMEVYGCPSV